MNSNISKRLLMETMLTLSQTEQIKNIRICDITDTIGFSKRVFFYHFESRKTFLNNILEYIFLDDQLCNGHMPVAELFFKICDCICVQQNFLHQCLADSELSEKIYELIHNLLFTSICGELDQNEETEGMDVTIRTWIITFNTKLLINHILLRLQRDDDMGSMMGCSKDIQLVKDFFKHMDAMHLLPLKVAFVAFPLDKIPDREVRLMDALKQISKDIPFSQIRVNDIIKYANISRSAFYRDNYSKHELRNRIWIYDILNLLNRVVDSAGNINYDKFQENVSQYYSDNRNLYEEGIIYDEYDSLYYAFAYQYDKSIRIIVDSMSCVYHYSGYAIQSIAYALAECVLSPITLAGTDAYRSSPSGLEQFYDLSVALKYMIPHIWDRLIDFEEERRIY